MPPKKGAKKGKKGEDEEYWQAKEAALPTVNPANGDDDDDVAIKSGKKKNVKSAFAMLQEEGGGGDEDDEEVPQPSSKSKKKKKNAPSPPPSDDDEPSPAPAAATQASLDDEWPEEDVKPKKGKKGKKSKKIDDEDLDVDMDAMIEEKKPIEVDMDDEFPDVKKKSKKDKKKKKVVDDDEQEQMDVDEEVTEVPVAPAAELEDEWPEEEVKKKGKKEKNNAKKEVVEVEKVDETVDAEENEEEGDGVKILSKKEKEKLKKEKEKAKKKAQAAAKKAETSTPTISEPAEPIDVVPESAAHAQEEDGDEDGDDVAGGAGDKKKKKKKKKAAAEVEEPKGKPKKVSAAVLALQRAMEDKKAAEAEAMRKAEEERLRIEEEDRRLEEEERVREEAKQLKKEKEKAKREQLRKEGKLLTPKQKAEQAAMEQRRKALLASGVKVEGLAGDSDKSKKVVYGNKKKQVKKAPVAADSSKSEAAPSAASEAPVEEAKVSTPVANAEEVDDWDKEDEDKVDDLVKGVEGVAIESGDDWDKSSSEDEAPPTPKATPAPAKVNQAPAAAPPLAKASAANGKKSTPAPAPAKKAQTNGADKPTATASASKAPPSAKVPAKGKAPAAKPVEEDSTEESEEDSDEESSEESSSESDSDDSDSETDSSEDELTPAQKKAAAEAERRLQEAAARRQQRHVEAMAARSKDDLRSPICCILGHVDTGKTKLLDKMRQTNVQEGEAGGITQQIGATFFPVEAIKEKTQVVNRDNSLDFKIPGLLIIDTPGHESFTNLRTRGSSLCNIAILVVDIMHGLEPQTLESLRLLKDRKTPFIVALNKIDRLLDWKPIPNAGFRETFNQQSKKAKAHFEDALLRTKTAFMENSLNSIIFDENKDFGRVVSLVPTSAITGEGIPDMIKLLVELTQQRMTDSLMYLAELECTVLEVKVIEGLGPTIDVVLSNGVMREGDKIVLCGSKGPIVTQVRALLTPQPMRELRVKSAYVHNKEVKASLGIKISAPGLADAIAGSRLLVCGPDDDEDDLKADVMKDFTDIRKFYTDSGVWVQASTLGSLEALLEFLKTSKIPVRFAEIGPVSERTVKSAAVQMDKDPMYGVMLCFDVVIDKDVRKSAEDAGLKVFEAQIIYHLFDAFTAYMKAFLEEKQKAAAPKAYWPCRLKILAAFAKRDPIVVGVDIIEGSIRVGTPLCVVRIDKTTKQKEIIPLGKITSIEINKKAKDGPVKKADIGGGAAIKIEHASYQASKMYGRHFDDSDELISQISRESIDILKTTFRKDVDLADWALIKSLKPLLDIP